jgi:hypothetical protein
MPNAPDSFVSKPAYMHTYIHTPTRFLQYSMPNAPDSLVSKPADNYTPSEGSVQSNSRLNTAKSSGRDSWREGGRGDGDAENSAQNSRANTAKTLPEITPADDVSQSRRASQMFRANSVKSPAELVSSAPAGDRSARVLSLDDEEAASLEGPTEDKHNSRR